MKTTTIFQVLGSGILAALLCAASGASARAGGPGTSGAAFMNVGMSARTAALGDTGAALRGIEAVAWNPAGLAGLEGGEVQFTRLNWLESISFDDVVGGVKTRHGVFALWLRRVGMDRLDGYDEAGSSTGKYDASDTALSAAWGQAFGRWSVGGALKYLSSSIAGRSASSAALDGGVQYAYTERLRFGLSLRNLGPGMEFDSASEPLPLSARLGCSLLAMRNRHGTLTGFLDVEKPRDRRTDLYAGAQYSPARVRGVGLFLRGGYRTRVEGLSASDGFTVGAGAEYNDFSLSYAYVPYGGLGAATRLSVGWRFGLAQETAVAATARPAANEAAGAIVPVMSSAPAAAITPEVSTAPVAVAAPDVAATPALIEAQPEDVAPLSVPETTETSVPLKDNDEPARVDDPAVIGNVTE